MKSRSLAVALALVLFAVIYFLGVAPRLRASRDLAARVNESDQPAVNVILAAPGSATTTLQLPGSLQPIADTAIYARTSGYLASWQVDLGDRVKAGQTLAVIDSPELDQELAQTRANREQARANLELARVSAARWKTLGKEDAVAAQDVDAKQAEFQARQADLTAAEANVQRLEQLKSFDTIVAPFAGVITARNVNVGNLISPGGPPELFHLSQSEVLRAYVNVPQSYVPEIKVGLSVDVLVAEFPAQNFSGEIARFSGALDGPSRTLLTEVQIPNADGRLYPGMFCQLRLRLTNAAPAILIPSNDAVIRGEGTLVAVVIEGERVHFQKVRLGRDYGTQIEVLSGLAPGDRVIENPSDALSEGETVRPVLPAEHS